MKIFDSHLHIIDHRFPLVRNQGYLPAAYRCEDYQQQVSSLGVVGGAVVSGSFQAFDQTYLLAALQTLGPAFVGVTQLPADVADEDILALDKAGVRALRFNLYRGGSAGLESLQDFALRVHELAAWHVELYIDSRELDELFPLLLQLPAVVIDHLGLSWQGLDTLCRLVEQGAMVKASGFGRLDFEPEAALRRLLSINPGAVMFGSDLPSTRAPRPFEAEDIAKLRRYLDDAEARRLLYDNAVALYRPRGQI